MGYLISCLSNIPCDDQFNMFIFILGKSKWSDSFINQTYKESYKLSKEVGNSTAIIFSNDGFEEQISFEIASSLERCSMKQDTKSMLSRLVISSQNNPAILILGNHPEKINEATSAIYITFQDIENNYKHLSEFFNDMCDFVKGKNTNLLKRFHNITPFDSILECVDISIPFGILSFNLKNFIKSKFKDKPKIMVIT